ncbi:class I SAM-dependent DNA methyltransferase [Hansschlegelia sp. KR7-227]|uniref:class I SAM-dependent DNA methyltransferase n=1 Tax=Hansschlegelia sp. KR7-227 TaxID=3400914 RepID=UPI003C01748D
MTPAAFIAKWSDATLRERQGSQEHFLDLCRLLGEPTPAEDDPRGERYCFERGAEKVGGGDGWADVWRRGCFGWEYKGRHKNLDAALRQLQAYALDLENPPYLVVCDMERIVVHTNWTNTVSRRLEFGFDDLHEPARLDELRQIFQGSERLKPGVSPQQITAKVAERFGALGRRLQDRGEDPRAVAHFLNRMIFCMFAEDAQLLPKGLFTRMVRAVERRPDLAKPQLEELFAKMRAGGFFGADVIRWFNGGLFDGSGALPLLADDLKEIGDTAAEHDWSQIDPAVFGAMFEEALKATRKRAALGAHYTDRAKILKIVDPVIIRPLTAEWEAAYAAIKAEMDQATAAAAERRAMQISAGEALKEGVEAARAGEAGRRKALAAIERRGREARARAEATLEAFLDRLAAFRVLDPACGSGNFLYVALHALRDLELRALLDAERLGIPQARPRVGLDAVKGIEIEPYAAELARVTLWIGDLQWMRKNGFTTLVEPILSSLDQIECRDALLTWTPAPTERAAPSEAPSPVMPAQSAGIHDLDVEGGGEKVVDAREGGHDGSASGDGGVWVEAEWPQADVIIGNPPFLGGKRLRDGLGDDTVERLFAAYKGRVPAEADFVCYWVEKAWRAIGAGRAMRAGLVTTNSIRGGANRRVLDPIADSEALMEAWADQPWILDGAAVRVSMIGFGEGFVERRSEGLPTLAINADLTSAAADLTKAARLKENAGVAFMGDTKGGAFDIPGDLAREWLRLPLNPNGRPNSDVLKPWRNAMDVTRRSADKWIIDFGWTMSEAEAALYEAPFQHALEHVKPTRIKNNRVLYRISWWRHVESRQGMWRALANRELYFATPRVAKHRIAIRLPRTIVPDSQLIVIAREDEAALGILHSRFHELWSLRMGSSLEDRPRYTPSTTFETFPFPEGLTPNIPAADYADDPRAQKIAEAAADLNAKRQAWLNPSDLVRIEPEVVPGYPDRILPRDEAAAKELKKRTLTNLYNQRPAWLDMAHRRLDAAVAAAYGWPDDLPDDEILERLFALNQERAAAGR